MTQEKINFKDVEVEFRSTNNLGIKPVGEEWINFTSDYSAVPKEEMRTLIGSIGKGDKIKLEMSDDKHFANFELLSKAERRDNERDVISFDTLLKQAKEECIIWVTKEIFHDTKEKIATFKCIPYKVTKDGKRKQLPTAHGDARPDNVMNPGVAKHYYRMAETRAIGRALRFALGIGDVTEEEIGGDE